MRRPERATPRIHERVLTEAEIRPRLRFLLSDEAKAEGKQMVRNFRGYTLSRPSDGTRCQFESIARGIREGRYPNIAAADELMGRVLVQSVEKIAGGFRQPEWMLWRQSWAHDLEKGRPDLMEGSAIRMMTRDERCLPQIIDDESAALPKTYADPVLAGGGAYAKDSKEWAPSRDMPLFRRYRDFIEYLVDTADGDKAVCIVAEPAILSARHSLYLALKPGPDGGAGFGAAPRGRAASTAFGVTFRLNPSTSAMSLAGALARADMMELAKTLLTPGAVDIIAAAMFADGLRNLDVVSAADQAAARRNPPMTKPPCLDRELWRRIPKDQRPAYRKAMAHGIVRGVHPDETVAELIANPLGPGHADREGEHYYLKANAKNMIRELEKLTEHTFDRRWKTKAELHAALRAHFKAAGYDELLDLRRLRFGAYTAA